MPNCAIVGCKNHSRKTSGRNIKYYRFPRNQDLIQQWIQACRRVDNLNLNNARVCSIHFTPNSFQNSFRNQLMNYVPSNYRALKDDAVPTENLPSSNSVICKGNFDNGIRRLKRKIIIEVLDEPRTMVDFVQSAEGLNTMAEAQHVRRPSIDIHQLLQETAALKARVRQLEAEVESLKTQEQTVNLKLASVNSSLRKHFTPGQIKRLLNPTKIYRSWAPEDIAVALSLRKVSSKAYRYLQAIGYPLPALSTLRKWVQQAREAQGIQPVLPDTR